MSTFAAIDTGTQTIRLLVAKISPGNNCILPVYRDRSIVCLGENTSGSKNLMMSSMLRSAECIECFIKKAHSFGVEKVFIAATACVREAENSREFLDMVFKRTGIIPEVLSGNMEAMLTLRGVQSVINTQSASTVVMDTGGGSTEFVLTKNSSVVKTESLPLGVLRLSEKYLKHDPPLESEISCLQDEISRIFKSASGIVRKFHDCDTSTPFLTATAGTATTLAAMNLRLEKYEPSSINGHVLSFSDLENLLQKMIHEPCKRRIMRPGLEPGRGTVIIPGTAILLTAMKLLGCSKATVSDAGLLEGIILKTSCS